VTNHLLVQKEKFKKPFLRSLAPEMINVWKRIKTMMEKSVK
jgi:hypothetical protein